MFGMLFKKTVTKRHPWPYSNEIKALLFFSLFIFLTTAFISYNPTDYSWFYYDTLEKPITNWCGYIGSCVAGTFFYLFGSSCFVLLCLILFVSHYFLLKKNLKQEWDRIIGYFFLIFVSSALCTIHTITLFSAECAGGYIGRFVCFLLRYWLDGFGSIILLYTMAIASFIVVSRFSFIKLLQIIVRPLSFSWIGYGINLVYSRIMNIYQPLQQRVSTYYSFIRLKLFARGHYDEKDVFFDPAIWHELLTKKKKKKSTHQISSENSSFAAHVNNEVLVAKEHITLDTGSMYELPKLDMFIGVNEECNDHALMQELEKRAVLLQEKLECFDVFGKVTAIKRGPIITLFEYQPQIDTKISKIVALEDDLALALQTTSIRIIAPIPGRSVVGFEVANKMRRNVLLASLIKSEVYKEACVPLPMVLGVDTIGAPVIIDLASMPHLLMAGSTGSGKSVALNAMLISLLCKISPDDMRLILIDPKRLEFAPYADIAHLLFPIVTDPKIVPSVLRWVVKTMEQRYQVMAQAGARNIHDYRQIGNSQTHESMPFIVVIIDELADVMMTAGKEVEDSIIRITQMARAAGIHLIAATQRPSVDVITGLIKVNFPSRISFRVTSKIDSRTILDCAGADKLLGKGDMLFRDSHDSILKRVHGAYVLDKEIIQVIAHIKSQREPDYLDLKQVCQEDRAQCDEQQDVMYQEVCQFLQEIDEVSISLLQRRFRIGYNRSARIIDMLESQGLIAPSYGGKTRKVTR